jgi:NhaA family Na+:H+ antiporter
VALPAIAALGGMLVPAAIYLMFNAGTPTEKGWGIPMATDIAFAVGVLTVVGKKVPSSLKVFLLTLAIVDDLGAIIVIAVFYTSSLNFTALGWAVAGLALMMVLRRVGVWWIPVYVMIGAGVWLATFESGIHATLAGVACGLLAPARPHRPHRTHVSASPETSVDELREILFDARESLPVADRLVRALHPWTALFIVPVFALANAGVVMSGSSLQAAFTSSASLAIIVGLVVGKPIGITLASFLAVKARIASLPANTNWGQLAAVAVLGGIGFTVSLFIVELAFNDEVLISDAKIGVLAASVLASILGAVALRLAAAKSARLSGVAPETTTEKLGPITFDEFNQTNPQSIVASARVEPGEAARLEPEASGRAERLS